jgi:hypothetical protein
MKHETEYLTSIQVWVLRSFTATTYHGDII